MKEMNDKFFEGALTRRIPTRDSNIKKNFQSACMMIGHSILQGGPPFHACAQQCPVSLSLAIRKTILSFRVVSVQILMAKGHNLGVREIDWCEGHQDRLCQ